MLGGGVRQEIAAVIFTKQSHNNHFMTITHVASQVFITRRFDCIAGNLQRSGSRGVHFQFQFRTMGHGIIFSCWVG